MEQHPTTFHVDLEGLTSIQKGFIHPARRFIYFRKGEALNNPDVVLAFIAGLLVVWKFVKEYPEFREGARQLWVDLKAGVATLRRAAEQCLQQLSSSETTRLPDFRELACPDNPEITMTMEILRSLGGKIRYLPREARGKLRFFVSDTNFCLFVRATDGTFVGLSGSSPEMITGLKEAFEAEWDEAGLEQDRIEVNTVGLNEARNWRDSQ